MIQPQLSKLHQQNHTDFIHYIYQTSYSRLTDSFLGHPGYQNGKSYWFYKSKIWWDGSSFNLTISKSFASNSIHITTPFLQARCFLDAKTTVSKHWRDNSIKHANILWCKTLTKFSIFPFSLTTTTTDTPVLWQWMHSGIPFSLTTTTTTTFPGKPG